MLRESRIWAMSGKHWITTYKWWVVGYKWWVTTCEWWTAFDGFPTSVAIIINKHKTFLVDLVMWHSNLIFVFTYEGANHHRMYKFSCIMLICLFQLELHNGVKKYEDFFQKSTGLLGVVDPCPKNISHFEHYSLNNNASIPTILSNKI